MGAETSVGPNPMDVPRRNWPVVKIAPVKPVCATKTRFAASAHGIPYASTCARTPVEDVAGKPEAGRAQQMAAPRQTGPDAEGAPANPAYARQIPTAATTHGMTSASTNAQ